MNMSTNESVRVIDALNNKLDLTGTPCEISCERQVAKSYYAAINKDERVVLTYGRTFRQQLLGGGE